MKKRILMISPQGFSPVRAYRGEGAFLQLYRLDPEIEILFPSHDEAWKDLMVCDIVYCFRTFDGNTQKIAALALDMGKPVWFDLDDDVYHVRRSHPNYAGLNNPDLHNIVDWFIRNATCVTYSTLALKESVRFKRSKNTMILPNALDDYTLMTPTHKTGAHDSVHWRGGASHQEDLLFFVEDLGQIVRLTKGNVHFHGWDPWFLDLPEERRHAYIPDYLRYMLQFSGCFPGVAIVPLMDCPFNRAKSNIAALEAIWCGALPVVPDWPEWQFPSVSKYENPSDFERATLTALGWNPTELHRIWAENMDFIREKYVLSVTNQARVKIIEKLMEGAR